RHVSRLPNRVGPFRSRSARTNSWPVDHTKRKYQTQVLTSAKPYKPDWPLTAGGMVLEEVICSDKHGYDRYYCAVSACSSGLPRCWPKKTKTACPCSPSLTIRRSKSRKPVARYLPY